LKSWRRSGQRHHVQALCRCRKCGRRPQIKRHGSWNADKIVRRALRRQNLIEDGLKEQSTQGVQRAHMARNKTPETMKPEGRHSGSGAEVLHGLRPPGARQPRRHAAKLRASYHPQYCIRLRLPRFGHRRLNTLWSCVPTFGSTDPTGVLPFAGLPPGVSTAMYRALKRNSDDDTIVCLAPTTTAWN